MYLCSQDQSKCDQASGNPIPTFQRMYDEVTVFLTVAQECQRSMNLGLTFVIASANYGVRVNACTYIRVKCQECNL